MMPVSTVPYSVTLPEVCACACMQPSVAAATASRRAIFMSRPSVVIDSQCRSMELSIWVTGLYPAKIRNLYPKSANGEAIG